MLLRRQSARAEVAARPLVRTRERDRIIARTVMSSVFVLYRLTLLLHENVIRRQTLRDLPILFIRVAQTKW